MIYDKLSNKHEYDMFIKKFPLVKTESTNYSVRYIFPKKQILLNEEGRQSGASFNLSNLCKNDAERYLKNPEGRKVKNDRSILWYSTNVAEELPEGVEEPIYKIDLSQAYWQKGVQMGVISEKTNKAFKSLNFKSYKEEKMARLRAFGSLATIKTVKKFKYGKLVDEFIKTNAPLRGLYMAICEEVANDMHLIMENTRGLYYYWDCVFVKRNDLVKNEVINEIEKLGYKCTVEDSNATVVNYGCKKMLHCDNGSKIIEYPYE